MRRLSSGIAAALGAALLFGIGTPLAKLLIVRIDPWLLAGLLYLGSGIGLTLVRIFRPRIKRAPLCASEWPWLIGAVISGGVIAPVLLMAGLVNMPASTAALLLNAESVFTAAIAWLIFRENVDRRLVFGMAVIVAGTAILTWPSGAFLASDIFPALAVVGACLCWGIDNNLTRKVSLADAGWLASIKGFAAGSTNLLLALFFGATWPSGIAVGGALALGFLAYGVSLVLFVIGLRHLGTARTGAYFSVAPFLGALVAVLVLDEPITMQLVLAGVLMATGVWLHMTERHIHEHTHLPLEHEHTHTHDEHHRHDHGELVDAGVEHTHRHRHLPMTHTHDHYPDAHHQHAH
nr:A7 [uncultured bacterium]